MYNNRIGSIRKRITIPIFSEKNYSSRYHGSFVIKKIVNNEKWKNEFCMSNDYKSKIHLIASKLFVAIDFW